jgi:hypothetical protein
MCNSGNTDKSLFIVVKGSTSTVTPAAAGHSLNGQEQAPAEVFGVIVAWMQH